MSKISEPQINLKESVSEAIDNYNKFRSPEATAKFVSMERNRFTIKFSGSFCYGCGVDAYFEDFIFELKRINSQISVKMKQFRQTSPESYEVQYVLSFPKSE